MDFRILGPLEVLDDGVPIDLGTRQQRALLAVLLLHANRFVPTDRILESLWPADPAGRESTMWVYVSRLRATLEPERQPNTKSSILITGDHAYSLVVDEGDIDADRFEHLSNLGRQQLAVDPDAAARTLRTALDLWRGAALEDFVYEQFAQADAARLEDLRLSTLEDRIEADITAGNHRQVVAELERMVMEHPLRERFVCQQMIALYRSGRSADALRAFAEHRRVLGEELGLEPSPAARRVEEQVLMHDSRISGPPEDGAALASGINPFNGLHAFGEADSDRFFGRDHLIEELIARIGQGRSLLALVGASGSGKSSILRAGLIPAIGTAEWPQRWTVVTMVPGSRPFREAEAALVAATEHVPDDLAELLTDGEDGLLRAALSVLAGAGSERMLLVIDQLEELFTLGSSVHERGRFVRNLEVVLDDPHGRVVVAFGLRADFYGHPLEYRHFAQMLADGIVNVVPLTPEELEAAAERPAANAGASLERALLVQLLGDVAGQSGGLPLFQYALTELFERRDGAVLTLEAYEDMGGISGAIARRAEDVFLALGSDEREATRQLALRLVTIMDQGARSRRRVTASEIAAISEDLVALQTVIARFAGHRLLTLDRDPVSGSPTVEVAHEALLDEWPRLRRWIDEGHRDVLTRARLEQALHEWRASGCQTDYLLYGQRLADYEAWAEMTTLQLSSAEQRFLTESIRHRQSELRAEEERHAREVKLDRAARHRLWGLGAMTAAVVGVVASWLLLAGSAQPAIAVVHGAAGDLGIADMMIAGVGDTERSHDIEVDLVEPLVDAEEDLRRLAQAGTELIVVTREFDGQVGAVAADYPEVHWVAVDPAAVHVKRSNISEMHFEVEDSAFLAGAAAALTTSTDRIGFIGGYQTFRSEASRNGFERGARWINPDIDVRSTFIGPVVDPVTSAERRDDLSYELARSLYEDEVDIIFHDAGAAGRGVTRAAVERSTSGDHVWTIGSDADEYLTLPAEQRQVVLSSTIKRFDTAVKRAIDGYLSGELLAGDTLLGLSDNGVGLSRAGGQLAAIDGRLKSLEGELVLGHMTVSSHAARPPTWQHSADVSISLRQTDAGCEIEATSFPVESTEVAGLGEVLAVDRDSVVHVSITNESSDIAGLVLHVVPVGTSLASLQLEADAVGPAASLGVIQAMTTAQLGGASAVAAIASDLPLVLSCVQGVPNFDSPASFPLIVSPT